MNCTEFNSTFTDSDGNSPDGLSVGQRAEFDVHRGSCEACQAVYEAEVALLIGLRKMPVPEPSADFADRVLRAAVAQTGIQTNVQNVGHHQRHGFMLGFGSAAVAAMALWVVVGVLPGANEPVGNVADATLAANAAPANSVPVNSVPVNSVPASSVAANSTPAKDARQPVLSIALNQQQDIKLAFYSGEPLKGAKITIRLPENVALVGYPGRRQLSWTTDLKKGDNLLRLPVIATQIARGELTADIEYGSQLKTLTLGLETSASNTSTGEFKVDGIVG